MSVVVSIEEAGPSKHKLTVEVPAAAVDAELERVTRDVGRNVSISGFRKGKVPASVVRRRFSREIDREVVERLLPRYWEEATRERELDVLSAPEVEDVGEIRPGEPLTFVASVETRPEVELGELPELELPDPEVEPSEEEVRQAVDELRRQVADWVPADREAVRGDQVAVEITELPARDAEGEPGDEAEAADGETPADEADEAGAADEGGRDAAGAEAPRAQPLELEVGDEQVWEELSLAVTGLAAGQRGEFRRREQGSEGTPASERRFEVKVTEVRERDLPEVDEEFVKRVGDFDAVEAFEQAVVERLRAGKERGRGEERRRALLEQLRRRYPLTLPRGVVDQEIEGMAREYAGNLASQGVDVENAEIDWRRLFDDIRPHAERRVHDRLLLDAIAEREGIRAEGDEVEATIAALARAEGQSAPAFRRRLAEADRLESLERQLRRDKTVRHLLGELPEGTEEEPAGAAEAGETAPGAERESKQETQ